MAVVTDMDKMVDPLIDKQFEQLQKQSMQLTQLELNFGEISNSIKNMENSIQRIDDWILNHERATAALSIELDTKTKIRDIQQLIQITLLQFANILSFAKSGYTSPYALTQT